MKFGIFFELSVPLWVTVTSPGTELDAGRRGLGNLGLTFGGPS